MNIVKFVLSYLGKSGNAYTQGKNWLLNKLVAVSFGLILKGVKFLESKGIKTSEPAVGLMLAVICGTIVYAVYIVSGKSYLVAAVGSAVALEYIEAVMKKFKEPQVASE